MLTSVGFGKITDNANEEFPQRIYDHCGNWFRSLSEMAFHYDIDRKTLAYRLKVGWSIEDALTKPSRCKNKIISSN